MKRQTILAMTILAGLGLAGGAAAAKPMATNATSPSFSGHKLAGHAKVSLAEARSIALKARAGDITDQELETERGGTGLRYSFDVKSGGKTFEVGVDARTGAVLENKAEGKTPD